MRNNFEAVGVIQAWKGGISLESVRRPLSKTKIHNGILNENNTERKKAVLQVMV